MSLLSKVKNVFNRKPRTEYVYKYHHSGWRPGSSNSYFVGEQSIINSIYSRMAMDVASVPIKHVRCDPDTGRYEETIKDDLNDILTVEANKDQTSMEFILDICDKMFRYGFVAGVQYDVNENTGKVETMRTGIIKEWYPDDVLIDLYDDRTGYHRDICLPKNEVCIFVNPLFQVMNEQNSVLQRLLNKLSLLDSIDDKAQSGKLDLIIQLPYTTKTEVQQKQAEKRQQAIENQLANSHYGIAYIDSTEHITQLNRPAENNLLSQVQYLTDTLYSQLGMTKGIFDGTADEQQKIDYYNRTIEPFLKTIVNEMNRKLLSKTARSQGQAIMYFVDPFRLASINNMAEMADKFIRNEILTKNEFRAKLGYQPSDDPEADKLQNPNLNRASNDDGLQIDEFPEDEMTDEFDEDL